MITFVISCDEDPEDILDMVRQEWMKQGGKWLGVKALSTHNAKSAVVFYKFRNDGDMPTIELELERILTMARDAEAAENQKASARDHGEELVRNGLPQ
jgi:hypothetical protein